MRGVHRLKDLTGQCFNDFSVVRRDESKGGQGKSAHWICRCSCGSLKSVRSDVLRKRCPKSCGCASANIKPGNKFGHLTVAKQTKKEARSKHWECKCSCGNKIVRSSNYLKQNSNSSCGCMSNPSGIDHPCFKGYKGIYASVFNDIKRGAKKRNLKFKIDIEYLWELYEHQNGTCSLSGREIPLGNKSQCTASLDRIDSGQGYIKGNVQWVYKKINIMKNSMSTEDFVDLCKAVASHN